MEAFKEVGTRAASEEAVDYRRRGDKTIGIERWLYNRFTEEEGRPIGLTAAARCQS